MDSAKLVPMLVGLLLAVVMVGAVFVPVISSSTTRTVTTEIENEGAEWLKLGYNQGTDYSFTVGFDGEDNFTVGTQTGEYENLICYADNERTLFVSGDNWYLLTNGETPSVHKFTENASVTNASGTLTITDGETTVYTGASPTWAYVPDSQGRYAFFTDGELTLDEGKPTVAVGSYAGVFAYNNSVAVPGGHDLGLTMVGNYEEGNIVWKVLPSDDDSLNLAPIDSLNLTPIDIQPIDLGVGSGVGLMSANPGTGTQVGDLYYTFSGSNATVIGYSSSTNWATFSGIPETVTYGGSTYTVNSIDNNAFQGCTGLAITSLPNTITSIGSGAFNGCTNLALTSLPDNIINIPMQAFNNCTNLALTSLPDGITSIGQNSLYNCRNITITVIPASVESIGGYAFKGCSSIENLVVAGTPTLNTVSLTGLNLNQVLNLGENEITTSSYGMTANEVRSDIPAIGYIGNAYTTTTEVVPIDSPAADIMQILPLIAGIGALFFAVGTMIYTRF